MGARGSKTEQELLRRYEDETFLTKDEITWAYTIFSSFFAERIVPSVELSRVSMQDLMEKLPFLKYNPFRDRLCTIFSTYPASSPLGGGDGGTIPSISVNGGQRTHYLTNSPSSRQLAASAGGGSWCFDDFIHFLSAFNEKAPVGLKQEVAFCIYDSDGDGYIGEHDLLCLVKRLVGDFTDSNSVEVSRSRDDGAHPYDVQSAEKIKDEDYKRIVEQVFQEADLDRDRKMALKEFINTMAKFPDFARHFCVPSLENYV